MNDEVALLTTLLNESMDMCGLPLLTHKKTKAFVHANKILKQLSIEQIVRLVDDYGLILPAILLSDVNVDVTPPKIRYSNFNFNTDFNYSKLVQAGVFNAHWNSGENNVYHHGLGYIPEVEAWQEDNSGVVKKLFNVYDPSGVNFSSMGSRIVYAKITTQDFIIRTDGANQDITKIHYRIYGDQNG